MIWLQDSFERILPEHKPPKTKAIAISGAQQSVVAFQIGLRPARTVKQVGVKLSGPLAKDATVRLAGLVPLRHHTVDNAPHMIEGQAPGFVPDPLVPLDGQVLDAGVSRSLWVSVKLPKRAGESRIRATVTLDEQKLGPVDVTVHAWPFALPPLELPVTNWFYSDALVDWYKVEPLSPRYWELVGRYFANLVEHNQTVIYTPLFTPPLDKEKRDLQLVEVTQLSRDRYRFGWRHLNRWLDLAESAGFRYFEMSHLFSQWGAAHAIRILATRPGDSEARPLWPKEEPATGPRYRKFLEQFLPALVKLLKRRGAFDRCIFHLSDEPHETHLKQYRAIREMVRAIAPEIRITEALSNVAFYRSGLIDHPVPVISTLSDFVDAGARPWTYYCCNPRQDYPNRFLDYPLFRLRVLAPMLRKYDVAGFLHWGLNYWYKAGTKQPIDPFLVTDAWQWPNWTAGDPFILYPGADGPMDSVRWEAFRETFDDYRLLTLAERRLGRPAVLRMLKDITGTGRYPQKAEYLRKLRDRAASACAVTAGR